MNLASRCNRCGTLFRVVRDQLWISDGWVRCGRCGCAFNAFDHLYDLQQGQPPAWAPSEADEDASTATASSPSAPAEEGSPLRAAAPAEQQSPPFELSRVRAESDDDDAQRETPERFASPGPAPSADRDEPIAVGSLDPAVAAASDSPVDGPHDDGFVRRRADAAGDPDAPTTVPMSSREDEALATEAETVSEPWATPEFVRRAERQARWRSPPMRIALAALSLLLTAALLLQAGIHFRDRLAAQSPRAAGALGWLCGRLNCTIEAPRRIADVTVESSVLSRVPGESDLVRLSLTLRNRGPVVVALPAIDLSLTDGAGKVVARRALQPAELRPATPVLPPNTDVPLQLLLATSGQSIAGYTLEVFYP